MLPARLARIAILLGVAGVCLGQDGPLEDIRGNYGTPTMQAARHIDRGVQLQKAKKAREAILEFREAIRLDPQCRFAHYWMGIAHAALGEIDEALKTFEAAYRAERDRGVNVGMEAACQMGDILFTLARFDDASLWYTRAILYDPPDDFGRQARCYHNLSVGYWKQNRYTAALVAAIQGHLRNPEEVPADMLLEATAKVTDPYAAQVLWFGKPAARPAPRVPGRLAEANVEPGQPTVVVDQFLPDPSARYTVAISRGARGWWLITTAGKPEIQVVSPAEPMAVRCAQLLGDSLYLATSAPSRVVETDPRTGRKVRSWDLGAAEPASIAVTPSQEGCYWTGRQGTIQYLDFLTGRSQDCGCPGEGLVAHPALGLVFCLARNDPGAISRNYLVAGRMLPVRYARGDEKETPLLQFAGAGGQLFLSGFRDKAALRGNTLSISPDGKWAALVGEGFSGSAGGGLAVLPAINLEGSPLFFPCEGPPRGCAFNPVTDQVAVVGAKKALVYHLSDANQRVDLAGAFGPASAWTGDGRFLLVAREGGGVAFFGNELDEREKGLAWWKELPVPARPAATAASPPAGLGWLAEFQPSGDSARVAQSLKAALAAPPAALPVLPAQYPPYRRTRAYAEVDRLEKEAPEGSGGVRIYRLRALLKDYPDSVFVEFHLGKALYHSGQFGAAREAWTHVLRLDQGRTRLSLESLYGMAFCFSEEQKALPATDCLAAALRLDPENPITIGRLLPFLEKTRLTEGTKALQARLAAAGAVVSALPELATTRPGRALSASAIYERAAAATVLVAQRDRIAVGVCVSGDGSILTNHWVVSDGEIRIRLHPYAYRDGKLSRLEAVEATIVRTYPELDLAVLRPIKPIPSLKPLPVAAANARAGEKIFAVGSPGLAEQVLDLTLSEGIVSSASRMIEGREYLQHTAAVNAGNAGGPLMDESGQIVGIVAKKAPLEGVSFALPVSVIRSLFPVSKSTTQP